MNKFRPKKSSPRKVLSMGNNNMNASERALEFGLDYNNAHMKLGDDVFIFDTLNGNWINGKLFGVFANVNCCFHS